MNTLHLPSLTFRPAAFLSGAPGPWAGHLTFACDLITALKPQTIVELGVYYGDSYFGFCQTVAEHGFACTCYGVDSWEGGERSAYDTVSRYNDRHYRAFSHLLRHTFDEGLDQFRDQSIGLLHLNALHSFEAAQHDFDRWLPKVRLGGVILLHNIAVRAGDWGVWRLWEDLQSKFPSFAFHNAGGLGVLWKTGGTDKQNVYLEELFCGSAENQGRVRHYYNLCAERLELGYKLEQEHAECEQMRTRDTARLEEERKAQIASAAGRERERTSHNLLSQDLSIARGNVDELKAEIESLTAMQAETQSELSEARKLNARLAATLDQERVQRARMEKSAFWQMTKPVRLALERFRGLKRR
ncbi:MAG TPA: class I SAM-dependent methyltransferase [Bryobacteraceae bacterium]